MVDADFAEFINDHRNATAVFSGQNAVKKGRFPGAEKAGQDRHWNSLIICFGHRLEFLPQLFCKGNNSLLLSQL
jgi:hypothetical protein